MLLNVNYDAFGSPLNQNEYFLIFILILVNLHISYVTYAFPIRVTIT